MHKGTIVSLKNPQGDDHCIGIVEGSEEGKVKVVYFPATSPTEHALFDEADLEAV